MAQLIAIAVLIVAAGSSFTSSHASRALQNQAAGPAPYPLQDQTVGGPVAAADAPYTTSEYITRAPVVVAAAAVDPSHAEQYLENKIGFGWFDSIVNPIVKEINSVVNTFLTPFIRKQIPSYAPHSP